MARGRSAMPLAVHGSVPPASPEPPALFLDLTRNTERLSSASPERFTIGSLVAASCWSVEKVMLTVGAHLVRAN